jgi:arsenite methyltransferase
MAALDLTHTASISVYDPPMCCSTGLCGPSVDPQLLQVARDLRRFEAQGVAVERFNLAQQPDAFVQHPKVAGLMQAFGEKALPVILINGDILAYGRYPSREEMTTALKEPHESEPAAAPCADGGCDCGSGGCN